MPTCPTHAPAACGTSNSLPLLPRFASAGAGQSGFVVKLIAPLLWFGSYACRARWSFHRTSRRGRVAPTFSSIECSSRNANAFSCFDGRLGRFSRRLRFRVADGEDARQGVGECSTRRQRRQPLRRRGGDSATDRATRGSSSDALSRGKPLKRRLSYRSERLGTPDFGLREKSLGAFSRRPKIFFAQCLQGSRENLG